jgi:hypothetical protein
VVLVVLVVQQQAVLVAVAVLLLLLLVLLLMRTVSWIPVEPLASMAWWSHPEAGCWWHAR